MNFLQSRCSGHAPPRTAGGFLLIPGAALLVLLLLGPVRGAAARQAGAYMSPGPYCVLPAQRLWDLYHAGSVAAKKADATYGGATTVLSGTVARVYRSQGHGYFVELAVSRPKGVISCNFAGVGANPAGVAQLRPGQPVRVYGQLIGDVSGLKPAPGESKKGGKKPEIVMVSGSLLNGVVYLAPLGDFSAAAANDLAGYLSRTYGTPVRVGSRVAVPQSVLRRGSQVEVNDLYRLMVAHYKRQGVLRNRWDTVIGLTNRDMNNRAGGWAGPFCFSTWGPGTKAVVSSARLDPTFFRLAPNPALTQKRLRKIVAKCIGFTFYGFHERDNPRSLLYKQLWGLAAIDNAGHEY